MPEPIVIPLRSVIDRGGKKIATTLRTTTAWGEGEEYVVRFGDRNVDEFSLKALFRYVLADGLGDFEILHEEWPCLSNYVPAGEIRALVREIMGQHKVGVATLLVQVGATAALTEPPDADDISWLSGHPSFVDDPEVAMPAAGGAPR